jgi:DNA polymerase I
VEDSPEFINAFMQGDSTIVLVSRDASGRRVERHVPAEYVAYFLCTDLDERLQRDLRSSIAVKGVKREGDWVRVSFVAKAAREDVCTGRGSFVSQLGIPVYEADVHPIVRYIVDHQVKLTKPKRVYLDLETDSRVPFSSKEDMRILCWSLVDELGRTQLGVLDQETDRDEKRVLEALWAALEPYDQVCAWNGDGFDFPVLFARSEYRGIPVDGNRWLWLDHMELFRRMNLNASESGDEKQSMHLQDIAQAVVGEGKEVTPPHVIAKFGDKSLGALSWQLWEAGGEWRDILVRYNVQDTDLLRRIELETGYIALFDTLCEVCKVQGDSAGLNPTHQMDGFMLSLGMTQGEHFPTKRYRDIIEKFKGAYVMDPTCKGIQRHVHVCDFKSLYPSVILTWNMSPDTKVASHSGSGPIPEGTCVSPLTNICFQTDRIGLLPIALGELIRLRDHWKKLKASFPPGTPEWQDANRKSTAYKVAANSFYGVVGSPFSRFFDRQIAESVTQNSKWLLLKTMEAAEKRGWTAIYGDTDSIFIIGCTDAEFGDFVKWCNKELYPVLVEQQGCTVNEIKLAYEKAFDRLVLVTAKRYAGNYLHFDGKPATAESKPEIKGLEYKRGDALFLARQLQAQTIDLLCGGLNRNPGITTPTDDLSHFHNALAEMRTRILSEPLPIKEIKLAKALSKPLREYAQKVKKDGTNAAQPPHVVVAKILKSRGEDVNEGTRIEYIVTDGSVSPMKVIPASDYTGIEMDRFYLWEEVIYPPTQRLLEAAFPNHKEHWDTWLKVRPPKPRAPRKTKPKELPETDGITVHHEAPSPREPRRHHR